MAYSQLFFSFACRSETRTLAKLGVLTNPYLIGANIISGLLQLSVVALPFARPVFETVPQPAWQWLLMFALALLPATLIELGKMVRELFARQPDRAAGADNG